MCHRNDLTFLYWRSASSHTAAFRRERVYDLRGCVDNVCPLCTVVCCLFSQESEVPADGVQEDAKPSTSAPIPSNVGKYGLSDTSGPITFV